MGEEKGNSSLFAVFVLSLLTLALIPWTIYKTCGSGGAEQVAQPWLVSCWVHQVACAPITTVEGAAVAAMQPTGCRSTDNVLRSQAAALQAVLLVGISRRLPCACTICCSSADSCVNTTVPPLSTERACLCPQQPLNLHLQSLPFSPTANHLASQEALNLQSSHSWPLSAGQEEGQPGE